MIVILTGGRPKNDEVLEKAGEDVKARTTLFRNVRWFVGPFLHFSLQKKISKAITSLQSVFHVQESI